MPSLVRELAKRNLSAIIVSCPGNQAAASQASPRRVLPKGAIPVAIQTLGGATGGTNPTMDVGITGDQDYFHNELDADTPGAIIALNGVGSGVKLTAPTEVLIGVGASAAAGGTHRCVLYYLLGDQDGAGE